MSYSDLRQSVSFGYRTDAKRTYLQCVERGLEIIHTEPLKVAFFRKNKNAVLKAAAAVDATVLLISDWPEIEQASPAPQPRSRCATCGIKLPAQPVQQVFCSTECELEMAGLDLEDVVRTFSVARATCSHWTGPYDVLGTPRLPRTSKDAKSGVVYIDARMLVWLQTRDTAPPGHFLRAKCKSDSCVALGHLYLTIQTSKFGYLAREIFRSADLQAATDAYNEGATRSTLRSTYKIGFDVIRRLAASSMRLE